MSKVLFTVEGKASFNGTDGYGFEKIEITEDNIEEFAINGDWSVKATIACNKKCPPHILKTLMKNGGEDLWVFKKSILENPNCPEILKLLYK